MANFIVEGIAGLAKGIVSPVTGYYQRKNDNKTKVKLAQVDRLVNSENKAAELDQIIAENAGDGSWKDEYVTIIITLPIPTLFFAVLYSAYTGDPTAANAAKEAVSALKELIPDYNRVLYTVCLAAIGVRAFTKLKS